MSGPTLQERLRIKLCEPDYPNNLTEEEWRALVIQRLDGLVIGFGKKLKSLYDRIEWIAEGGKPSGVLTGVDFDRLFLVLCSAVHAMNNGEEPPEQQQAFLRICMQRLAEHLNAGADGP